MVQCTYLLLDVFICSFFYLCDTISVGFGTVAATETYLRLMGLELEYNMQLYGLSLLFVLFVVACMGTKVVAKITPFAMIAIFAGFLSIFTGAFTVTRDGIPGFNFDTLSENVQPEMHEGVSFATFVGLLFPCFAGVMTGAYRSGVLKDPSKSIPNGTIAGVSTITSLYTAMFVTYAASITRDKLLDQSGHITSGQIAPYPIVVSVGTIMCAVGAALQGISGTPHLLIAMSKEKNIPGAEFLRKLLAFGRNKRNLESEEPPIIAMGISTMVRD